MQSCEAFLYGNLRKAIGDGYEVNRHKTHLEAGSYLESLVLVYNIFLESVKTDNTIAIFNNSSVSNRQVESVLTLQIIALCNLFKPNNNLQYLILLNSLEINVHFR